MTDSMPTGIRLAEMRVPRAAVVLLLLCCCGVVLPAPTLLKSTSYLPELTVWFLLHACMEKYLSGPVKSGEKEKKKSPHTHTHKNPPKAPGDGL